MAKKRKPLDMSKFPNRFADRLRKLRERAGMDVEHFAQSMASAKYPVAASTVYAWENGRSQPPLDAFPVIAEVLGVAVRTLLPPE